MEMQGLGWGTLVPGTGPCRLASCSIKNFATRLKDFPILHVKDRRESFHLSIKLFPKCILLRFASSGSQVIITGRGNKASKEKKIESLHAVVVVVMMKQHQEPLPRWAPVCHFRPAGSTSPAPGGPRPRVLEAFTGRITWQGEGEASFAASVVCRSQSKTSILLNCFIRALMFVENQMCPPW